MIYDVVMDTEKVLAWQAIYAELSGYSLNALNLTLNLLPYTSIIFVGFIAFFIAGVVKGITGLGLPITAMSLLGLFFDIRFAVCLVIIPIIFTNLLQLASHSDRLEHMKKYWRLILTMAVMTFMTSALFLSMPLF